MPEWVVGIDLGATKIDAGLVDPENRIIARRRILTESDSGPQMVVERIAQSVTELEQTIPGGQRLGAMGICSPGPVDHQAGMLLDPPNLQALHHTPLRQLLEDRLKIPVNLEHDAKAAALGEFYYGAGQGEQSMVYIVVGTGVGAAIIIEGQVYRGLHNFAGEVGHITLDPQGNLCPCGSRGCVETYTSGPWLARHYQNALVQHNGAPSVSQDEISGALVAQLAAQGDELALQVITRAGEALGISIASLAMILNIDLYVIGGSVAKAGDVLLEPARKIVPKYSFKSVSPDVRIVATELDTDGPILGCAWQARQLIA
ncbi:MAG: ROK family protein [Candidatus Vecturithrix sp.]|nr:ROK family protein [Candidatus Vecturithrix sp.]